MLEQQRCQLRETGILRAARRIFRMRELAYRRAGLRQSIQLERDCRVQRRCFRVLRRQSPPSANRLPCRRQVLARHRYLARPASQRCGSDSRRLGVGFGSLLAIAPLECNLRNHGQRCGVMRFGGRLPGRGGTGRQQGEHQAEDARDDQRMDAFDGAHEDYGTASFAVAHCVPCQRPRRSRRMPRPRRASTP